VLCWNTNAPKFQPLKVEHASSFEMPVDRHYYE